MKKLFYNSTKKGIFSEIFTIFLFIVFWWLWLTAHIKPDIQCLKWMEYCLISIKKISNTEILHLRNMFIYTLSTLLKLLYHELLHQCSAAWRRSACGCAEVLLKLRLLWLKSFNSFAFLGHIFLIFFSKHHMGFYGVQVRWDSWPIKHTNIIVSKPFGSSSGKCSHDWHLQHIKAWGFLKSPGRCCTDFGFDKTQWTNISRWHDTPNNHRLWKLHTGLQTP